MDRDYNNLSKQQLEDILTKVTIEQANCKSDLIYWLCQSTIDKVKEALKSKS